MIGKYKDNIKIDTFLFYYPNGNLKTRGFYKNNVRWGIWVNYYTNGKIRDKLVFNNVFLGVLAYFDKAGNPKIVNGTGKWDSKYFNDFTNSYESVYAEFKDTLRNGTWKYYTSGVIPDTNHFQLTCEEIYDNGKYISGKYYWGGGAIQNINAPVVTILPESNKFQNTEKWKTTEYVSKNDYPFLKFLPEVDSTLLPVDVYASFPGGLDSLLKSFQKNIKISKSDIKENRHYLCMFRILIDKSGKIKIIEDPNKIGLSIYPQERPFYLQTKKTIKNLPNWEPAKRNNKNVPCLYILTITWEEGKLTIYLASPNKDNPFKNQFPVT